MNSDISSPISGRTLMVGSDFKLFNPRLTRSQQAATVFIESVLYYLSLPVGQKLDENLFTVFFDADADGDSVTVTLPEGWVDFLELIYSLPEIKKPTCLQGPDAESTLQALKKSGNMRKGLNLLEDIGLAHNFLPNRTTGRGPQRFKLKNLPFLHPDKCLSRLNEYLCAVPVVEEPKKRSHSDILDKFSNSAFAIPIGECYLSTPKWSPAFILHRDSIASVSNTMSTHRFSTIPEGISVSEYIAAKIEALEDDESLIGALQAHIEALKEHLPARKLELQLDQIVLQRYGDIAIKDKEHLERLRQTVMSDLVKGELVVTATDKAGGDTDCTGASRGKGLSDPNILIDPDILRESIANLSRQKLQALYHL